MFQFLKEYFSFTKGQRNGIIVLLIIILVLLMIPYLIPLLTKQKEIDFSQFQKEIEEFEEQQLLAEDKSNHDTSALAVFDFDPNELSEAGWKKLGLDERTVRTIINYRNKGGHFFEKDDLLKIYGMDTAVYEQLEPYIKIDEDAEATAQINPLEKSVYKAEVKPFPKTTYPKKEEKPKYEPKKIELNSADSALLVTVNGIGPVLSKRIIKYRNRLGGFVKVDQLLEVYGMDSVWFQRMKSSLLVDTLLVSKIPINSIPKDELQKHPYIGWNLAKVIDSYRQQHGAFATIDDLKKVYLMDEAHLQKISPYVSLQ